MRGPTRPFGALLRGWRERRRVSQLALACDAEISTKHLSFLETGRSYPSREMVLRLSRVLALPLRERNELLHAAGFAAAYPERSLNDPALAPARRAVDLVLRGLEPYPALAIDRHWTLIAANRAIPPLLDGVDPALLEPPVNVLRLGLHPRGLAPRTRNLATWRAHLLERLRSQIEHTGDDKLSELMRELMDHPEPPGEVEEDSLGGIAVPLVLDTPRGVLHLLSTTTVFGTPVEVTLSELAIESFFPADAATLELLGGGAGAVRAEAR